MNVLLNDPPRARREGYAEFVSLAEIREESDIITFHVPLNMEGVDRTYHMVDDAFLRGLQKPALIVNTCRGEVFDTRAVIEARLAGRLAGLVIDCWENEPDIDLQLLGLVDYATPHIAGYSRDGKANGTTVSVRAISRFFGLGIDDWEPAGIEPPPGPVISLDGRGKSAETVLADAVLATYEIARDDRALRNHPGLFEQLRGDYPVRREFGSHTVKAVNVEAGVAEKLEKLGFRVSIS